MELLGWCLWTVVCAVVGFVLGHFTSGCTPDSAPIPTRARPTSPVHPAPEPPAATRAPSTTTHTFLERHPELAKRGFEETAEKTTDAGEWDFYEKAALIITPEQRTAREELYGRIWGPQTTSLQRAQADEIVVARHRMATVQRYLRARAWNVDKAEEMFRDTLAWRAEMDAKNIVNEPLDPVIVAHIRRSYMHSLHGFDKHGRLVYVERSGRLNVKQLFTDIQLPDGSPDFDTFVKYHLMFMEWVVLEVYPAEVARRGIIVDKMAMIWDLDGLSMAQFTSKTLNFIKHVSAIDQNNYPELMNVAFVVNAPRIFGWAWGIIKHFLEARVQEKCHILSGSKASQLAVLEDNLGMAAVPRFLGGTACPCTGVCANDGEKLLSDANKQLDQFYFALSDPINQLT